jgi:hypothetical protein
MRTTFGLLAALVASAAYADDGAGEVAKEGEAQRAQTQSAAAQPVQYVRPLHRHPTLFRMLQRNNQIRARAGLFGHRMNAALTAAAQDHANYMAATGQFSHYTNGGPQARAGRYGFRGGVRENIAMNGNSPDQAFVQWTGSGAHYASIVSGTTDAGFGYAVGRNGMAYFVGVYGTPAAGDYVGESEAQIYAAYQQEQAAAQQFYAGQSAGADSTVQQAAAVSEDGESPADDVVPAASSQPTEGN